MDPDLQEARSLCYSDDVLILLPLTSGRLAVLAPDRTVLDITTWRDFTERTYAYHRKIKEYLESRRPTQIKLIPDALQNIEIDL